MKTTAKATTSVFGALNAAALGSVLVALPAVAQPVENDTPPVYQSIDENGVDQISGQMSQVMTSLAIGPGGPGSLSFNWGNSNATQSQVFGFVEPNSPSTDKYTVTIGGTTETFTLSSGIFSQDQGRGSTLTWDSGTSRFTYTQAGGTVAIFGQVSPGGPASPNYILSLTYPTGQVLTYHYRLIPAVGSFSAYYRVRSVVSNLGYQLHNDYALAPSGTYYQQTAVVLFNRANEACDPSADTCTLAGNWPRLAFTYPSATEMDATDNLSRLYRWINTQQAPHDGGAGTAGTSTLIFPTGRTLTYAIDEWGRVTSMSDGRGTWQYTHPNPFGGNTLTTYPEMSGPPRQFNFDPATGHVLSEIQTHASGGSLTTSYTWSSDRISAIAISGGPTTQYTYDTRGNVTETRRISATPGTPPDMVTSAVYPTTCANPRTCNQPTSTTDARGNVTDYTYDSTTGAVLTVTQPAPATGAARPQTVYGYTAYQAYYLNNAGSIVASGSNISLPTSISSCITGGPGTCAGTGDEARTTISYGPQTAGVANNLQPVSTTSGDGTGTLASTTAMTYTADGDVETVDGPLTGSADTTRTYYDAARRPIGAISPDPDGAGTLPRLASRTTYNDDNQPTVTETGTATDQSASGMSTFTSLRQQVTAYDAQGRATSVRLSAASTTYSLTQSSTTASGLPDCSALRMNSADFTSPPAACTQGTGGADRIGRIGYDWYRRLPITVTTGVGTALEAAEATTTYDDQNRVSTVADGQGNLTTYEYDGLGRQVKTRYPSRATPGTSSTTDFEQPVYATATVGGSTVSTPLIASLTVRDGRSIAYTYDNLGRLTLKDLPGTDPDVAYTYDNLGRMTSALFTASGQGVTNSFDALGRLASSASTMGGTSRSLSYLYDAIGNRTRITHPDGNYFRTDYDGLNRPIYYWANSSALIGSYYNAEGALWEMDRSGSAISASQWYYDGVQRLSFLAHHIPGTSPDVSWTLTRNPAGQIAGIVRTNDAYAWAGHYAVNRAYTTNGLNQYSAAGGSSLGYDDNGNLTSDGANAYVYDVENRLVSVSGAHNATLTYDPLGRLWQVATASTTSQFLYDGDALVAEYDGSNNLLNRHAHAVGADVPLMTFGGTGLGSPHFLYSDHQGSIVASADTLGGAPVINTYDEYGIPGAGNTGRFQYTGQAWLSELGLYYYKARMYSPTLGRFMQTDPIGYGAGMNLYNYVGGDPVNLVDPSGMQDGCPSDARGPCIVVTAQGCDGLCQLNRQIDQLAIDLARMHVSFGEMHNEGGTYPVPRGQQALNCMSNRRTWNALGSADVQANMRDSLKYQRQNHFEYGFVAGTNESGAVTAFGVHTSRLPEAVTLEDIYPWYSRGWAWAQGITVSVALHTHDEDAGLSQADVDLAEANQISAVAIAPNGNTYCYPAR